MLLNDPALELTDIRFRHASKTSWILDGLCLSVQHGEAVAVMGPFGVGKSTLLSVAGLLLVPQGGEVRVQGKLVEPRNRSEVQRSAIGWVLQNVSLLPDRSVFDNVALPLVARGASRADCQRPVLTLLEEMALDVEPARRARDTSGGQAQRIAIARALVRPPALLLVDEPTANLDPTTALSVAQRLVNAGRGRSALLLATHDPRVAALCDRVLDWEVLRAAG